MLFLAINYHYFGDKKYPYEGIYPVFEDRFAKQIDELSQYFELIGEEDLLEAVRRERRLPERCCMITFDDGLKEQYEVALPILKKGLCQQYFL